MNQSIVITVCAAALTALAGQAGYAAASQGTQPPAEPPQPTPTQPGQQPPRPIDPLRPSERPAEALPGQDRGLRDADGQPSSAARNQPGEHHKNLDWMTGTWQATVSRWHSPSAEPMEMDGRLTADWTLEGRFLRFEFDGKAAGAEGGRAAANPPFQGISFIGYNAVEDEYEGVWMDTTTTQLSSSQGHFSKETGTLTLHGVYADPRTGDEIKTRTEAHRESGDRWTWQMFSNPEGGQEFKSLEIVFTRQRGDAPAARPSRPPTQGGAGGR